MYLLFSGALVMWMAAGFTMLEAGLVRSKNVSEIVTKNIGLYSIACVMYLVCGFYIMYPGDSALSAYIPDFSLKYLGLTMGGQDKSYGSYAEASDFFFQVVFVATAMSIVSGAIAERMKLIPFFLFTIILTGFIYPVMLAGTRTEPAVSLPRAIQAVPSWRLTPAPQLEPPGTRWVSASQGFRGVTQ